MIKFKEIRWKNFLSYGNTWSSVDLSEGTLGLFVGKNGAGKSVLVDAVHYVLFGSPYRNINNGDLINRFNNKNLVVEVSFQNGTQNYIVTRGQKPAVFDIVCNGDKLPDQGLREQQELLEEILGFDKKTFTQIVLMGSGYHTPFLRLPLSKRREIIERLFDLDVISEMLRLSKEKYSDVKTQWNDIGQELKLIEVEIETKKSEVLRAEEYNKQEQHRIEKKREELKVRSDDLRGELDKLLESRKNLESQQNMKIVKSFIDSIDDQIFDIDSKIKRLVNEENVLRNSQLQVDQHVKKESVEKFRERFEELSNKDSELQGKIDELTDVFNERNAEFLKKTTTVDVNIKGLKEQLYSKREKLDFYHNNTKCDVCGQSLSGVKVDEIVRDIQLDIDSLETKIRASTNEFLALSKNKDEKSVLYESELANLKAERVKIQEEIDETTRERDSFYNEKKEKMHFDLKTSLKKVQDKKLDLENKRNSFQKEKQESIGLYEKYDRLLHTIKVQTERCADIELQLNELVPNLKDIDQLRTDLKLPELRKNIVSVQKKKKQLELQLDYLNLIKKICGDTGLKTCIIGKYVNVLNNKAKEFLSVFDVPYSLVFDEKLNTSVRVRGNEDVNYENFSGGERQRLDLVVLFVFMAFIKARSTSSTNLLIFDEVLDSSLDESGVDILFDLLQRMSANDGYAIYIISHRPTNIDRFDKIIEVSKDTFSKISEKKRGE